MRRALAPLALVLALALAALPASARSSLRIDPDRTSVTFSIEAIGWPTTTGSFRAFDGTIRIDLDRPERSVVTFTVEAASVDLGSPGMTDFAKSVAMLNVDKHPRIRFASTRVERTGERQVAVTGDLDFYGTVRPATFTVDVERGGRAFSFVATGRIHRTAFGFNSGQPLISDIVDLTITTAGTLE